ncbi:MAG: hypothetical protein JSS07_11830 [Proteobacteria bacterium]|nr:hypothetical protein [Pseudomonadota bacterium]
MKLKLLSFVVVLFFSSSTCYAAPRIIKNQESELRAPTCILKGNVVSGNSMFTTLEMNFIKRESDVLLLIQAASVKYQLKPNSRIKFEIITSRGEHSSIVLERAMDLSYLYINELQTHYDKSFKIDLPYMLTNQQFKLIQSARSINYIVETSNGDKRGSFQPQNISSMRAFYMKCF